MYEHGAALVPFLSVEISLNCIGCIDIWPKASWHESTGDLPSSQHCLYSYRLPVLTDVDYFDSVVFIQTEELTFSSATYKFHLINIDGKLLSLCFPYCCAVPHRALALHFSVSQ